MAQTRLKKLGGYLKPHWREAVWGTIALLIVNILGVYIPLLIRDSIDELGESFRFERVLHYVVLMLVLASLMWVIRMASRVLIFGIGRQVEFDLKQKIFSHLLTLEPSYFNNNRSGDLINRATSDVDNIRRLLGFAVLSLINTVFAYGFTLPAMIAIHLPLTLWAIAVYPFMLIVVQLFSEQLRQQQLEIQEKLSDLSELIQEDMSGISLVKIYAQEEHEREAFAQKNRELLQVNLKLARTRNLLFPLIESLAYISLLVLMGFGTQYIRSGEISVGDFVALIIFVERLVFPTALLGFTISTYQRGEVSVDRVEAILQAHPQISNPSQALDLAPEEVKGEIRAQHLTFTYPDGETPALKDINFTIKAGETVAVVGSVGSGKTTLANSLPRLLNVGPQQVFLDNRDITQINLKDLRRAIAYVPQDSFLFSTSLENNIRYGEPLAELPQVQHAAKAAQIHSEIVNFPQGYNTLVGERGITLSGGQRQRTSLARALLVEAPILILDDALSSVDNQTATDILAYLAQERGKTVIFISHQLAAAASADRIFVMDRGEIVQMGSHEELMREVGLYQKLWRQHQLEAKLSEV